MGSSSCSAVLGLEIVRKSLYRSLFPFLPLWDRPHSVWLKQYDASENLLTHCLAHFWHLIKWALYLDLFYGTWHRLPYFKRIYVYICHAPTGFRLSGGQRLYLSALCLLFCLARVIRIAGTRSVLAESVRMTWTEQRGHECLSFSIWTWGNRKPLFWSLWGQFKTICVKCLEPFERRVLGKLMVFLLFLGKPFVVPSE